MATHVTSLSWTEADIARLKDLSAKGASVVRAAAALNRTRSSVKRMAKLHGLHLAGTRQLKAAIRALEPKAAFSVYR